MPAHMHALEMMYRPRAAATEAARAPLWLPLAALALAGALADYPLLFELGKVQLADVKLRSTPAGLTPVTMLIFLVFEFAAPLLLPLAAWGAGEFMHFWLLFVMDARVARREVLGVTAYGFLPLAIRGVLEHILHWVRNPENNPFNPLASNVAFFFNSVETAPFWYEFARGVDLFAIWAMIATALGLAGLTKRSAAVLLAPLVAAWMLALLVKAWLLS